MTERKSADTQRIWTDAALVALAAGGGAAAAGAALEIIAAAAVAACAASAARWRRPPWREPEAPQNSPPLQQPLRYEPQRERAQTALAAFEAHPLPTLALDERRRILLANAAAEAEFGPGLTGRSLVSLLRAPDLLAAVGRAIDERTPASASFKSHRRQERHWIVDAAPLSAHAPGPPSAAADAAVGDPAALAPDEPAHDGLLLAARAVLVLSDATSLRRTEQTHRDFVANASHELRTPLAAIAGFIETLQGPAREDPTARDRFLTLMAQQAQRMRALLDDLMSLNRIELSEHIAPQDAVDLGAVLASAAADASVQTRPADEGAARAAAGEGRPLVDLPELDPPLELRGDAGELHRLFVNLLSNALKYGGRKAAPRVLAERSPEQPASARVIVEDFGPGIAPEHLPRLTERFYRIEEIARQEPGTGLGLAIVKRIVSRHRGEMRIDSALGRGTRVILMLPLAVTDTDDALSSDDLAAEGPGETLAPSAPAHGTNEAAARETADARAEPPR